MGHWKNHHFYLYGTYNNNNNTYTYVAILKLSIYMRYVQREEIKKSRRTTTRYTSEGNQGIYYIL